MLSTSLNIPVASVNVAVTIDGSHSFNIQGFGSASDVPAIGSSVTVYRSGNAFLAGIVTTSSYSQDGKISVAGQDASSYWAQNTIVDNAILSEYSLTTLSVASATISNKITCPSLPCYGYGSYSGSVDAYVNRIANSFGLHYIYNLLTVGVTLSQDVVEPSATATNVPTTDYNLSADYNNSISKIFLQKSVDVPEGTESTISNGTVSETFTAPLHNSLQSATSAYPIDVFIDPGSWEQVRLQTTTTVTTYTEPVGIGSVYRVRIDRWNDTTADPRWELFIFDANNNILKHWWITGDNAAWEGDDIPATTAVIARYKRDVLPPTLEYPDYNGLACEITAWDTLPTGLTGWEQYALSGDGGREDSNIIDDTMYPPVEQLDCTRIAKRDSNPNTTSLVSPGTDIGILALPETTYSNLSAPTAEHPRVRVPLVAMELTDSGNDSSTRLIGEW